MRHAYAVEPVRAAEAALMKTVPEGALMARAAAGLAATCAGLLRRRRGRVYGSVVVLLVGAGNNGGDALYAGARLAGRGARVTAICLGASAHGGGVSALRAAGGWFADAASPAGPAALDDADLVLDGITGIGGRGPLRPQAAVLVARAEAGAATIVAVDVPSGVDASTGEVAGAAVHADVTVTFGGLKAGLVVEPGSLHAGVVELVDIGLAPALAAAGRPDVEVLTAADVAAVLPRPHGVTDKYRRGVLGVRAGSVAYPGAAVLCAGAAARSGAGMVRFLGPDPVAQAVLARWPEVVVGDGQVQAWALGPGLDRPEEAQELLERPQPVVVDAGALAVFRPGRAEALLTPHAGELARLLGVDRADIEARRLHWVREAAARLQAVVLLKGLTTLVAAPDGRVRANPTGTPWLATAGSGDVLTGLAGALLAQGLGPFDAGAVAAWVHGLAARLAAEDAPVVAEDVLDALPAAMAAVAG